MSRFAAGLAREKLFLSKLVPKVARPNLSLSKFAPGLALFVAGLIVAGCGAAGDASAPAAARVNGHAISMAAYNWQFLYKRHVSFDSVGYDVCQNKQQVGLCKQLKLTVLNDLINEELVREYAATHHIVVTTADFNRQWLVVLQSKFHDNMPVLKAYCRRYGITISDLKSLVRQDLLQQAVLYQVTRQLSRYSPAVHLSRLLVPNMKQYRAVQSRLKRGDNFWTIGMQLAQATNTLCAQQGCGSLGWLPYAFVPRGEKQFITARDGTIVGPLSGQGGLAMLRVDAHQPHYLLTSQQQLALRNQIFADWLQKLQKQSSVRRYVAT